MPEENEKAPPARNDEEMRRANELYVKGVLVRGRAAKPINGKLPPGATHEIVKENEEGLPTIRRRRFSAF